MKLLNNIIRKCTGGDKNRLSCGRVDTAIWMQYMDADKTDEEKSMTITTQEYCEQF